MSTEMIRRVLYNAQRGITSYADALQGAEAEVEAIEKAAHNLSPRMGGFVQSAWDEGLDLMNAIADEVHQRNAGTAGASDPSAAGARGPQE